MSGFESAAVGRSRTVRENWSLRSGETLSAVTRRQSAHLSREMTRPRPVREEDEPRFPSLAPGDTFAGLRIERKLGQGGFGAVFLAEGDSKGDNIGKVALKVTSKDLTAEAFIHALVAGRKYHGLVESLDSGTYRMDTTEEYNYLVIKFVAGPTLARLLGHDRPPDRRVNNPLPPERAGRIAYQISLAAGEMHDAGLVHADIKPSNIILKNRESVALFDYGMTRYWPVPEVTDGTIRGTVSHMAPEQLVGLSFGPAADVFAIGLILWEMLTGLPAGEQRKPQIGIFGRKYQPLPPLPPHIPSQYQKIIDKATALLPENRYPDGRALAQALAEAQNT